MTKRSYSVDDCKCRCVYFRIFGMGVTYCVHATTCKNIKILIQFTILRALFLSYISLSIRHLPSSNLPLLYSDCRFLLLCLSFTFHPHSMSSYLFMSPAPTLIYFHTTYLSMSFTQLTVQCPSQLSSQCPRMLHINVPRIIVFHLSKFLVTRHLKVLSSEL